MKRPLKKFRKFVLIDEDKMFSQTTTDTRGSTLSPTETNTPVMPDFDDLEIDTLSQR